MTQTKEKRKAYKKKRYVLPIIVLIALVLFRMYLPLLIKNKINNVLANIPGFYGEIDNIDIDLYRGAYVLNGMYLNKVNAETQVPFLSFPKNDISIEWKSLFKGRVVSEITMDSPEIIYIFEDQQKEGVIPNADDWTKALTGIVPININNFKIHNGKIAFVQLQANPNIDLSISKIELIADNLRNVVSKESILPSTFRATGTTFGNGIVTLNGNINLIREIPDMDLAFSLKESQAKALNELTRHYAGIDFEKGTFRIYSEIAIADGFLTGYVKPFITDSKLISKDDGILETLWEGFIGFFKFILKNQRTDTLATKVPIKGNLNNVEAGTWPTLINIFKNAWIKAFDEKVDDDIEFKDAIKDNLKNKNK